MKDSSIGLRNEVNGVRANTYLISVRPQWARLFFDADRPKTVELRKGNFGKSLVLGDRLLIYATLPLGAVIGSVTVQCRFRLEVDDLFHESEGQTGVSEDEFDAYYAPSLYWGVGVWVENAELLHKPIALSELKAVGIAPPQQIARLRQDQLDLLFRSSQ